MSDNESLRQLFKEILISNPDYFDDILALNSPADLGTVIHPGYEVPDHLKLINKKLMDLFNHKIDRLAIFAPPRHSKSMTVSIFFTAWSLIKNPDENIVVASYGMDRAVRISESVREIIQNIGPLFGVHIDPTSAAKDFWRIKDHRGSFKAVGIGGGLTGHDGSILVLDDPMKNMEEALSPTVQNRTHTWFSSAFLSRLLKHGRVVLIQTIWSTQDIGYLIKEGKDPRYTGWDVVNLPARAEADDILGRPEGEPLWPSMFPGEELDRKRREYGDFVYTALYQQTPTVLGGGMLQTSWIQSYSTLPHGRYLTYTGWDLAISQKQQADYVTSCTVKQNEDTGDIYIIDITREKIEFPDQVKRLIEKYDYWSPALVGIESVGYQAALAQQVLSQRAIPIKQIQRPTDKVTRVMSGMAPLFENGKVYIHDHCPNLLEFEKEYREFPKSKHDDIIDAVETAISLCLVGQMKPTTGDRAHNNSLLGQGQIGDRRRNTNGPGSTGPRYNNIKRR